MNHSRSHELFNHAKNLIPGGVNSPVRSCKHVGTQPIYFERGEGPYLYDVDGNRYVDFCLSFGPLLLGHSHPSVVSALQEQATKATSFGACHVKEIELAELILKSYPFLNKVRLVNSGTEAVMTALRLARGVTGRPKILKFEGCYHGHSDGLLAKAGSSVAELSESSSSGVPSSIVKDTLIVPFDSITAIESAFKQYGKEIAAVIMEPIPANYGLWVPLKAHLEEICMLARLHGSLIIFDEVISGFRVGASGACGYYDLKPDIVTLGKIIGGGLPLAAVAGTDFVMSHLAPLGSVYQAGTLSGNPLATASGIAVLKEIQKHSPYKTLEERTKRFVQRLKAEVLPDWDISSVGSIFWLSPEKQSSKFPPAVGPNALESYAQFFRGALERGVYFAPSAYEVGFLSVMHTDAVLEEVIQKLKAIPK